MSTVINRRQTLGLMGGAAAGVGALGASAPAAAAKTLDLTNRADYFKAIMQMRGALDNRLCMGFIKGNYYGVVDNVLTPLYGVLGGTFSKYKQRDDGNFDMVTFEVAYFTDWNTGELMDTYANPYTGKTVKVPITRMGPSKSVVTPDGLQIGAGGLPGASFNHKFLPARISGDEVWIVEQNLVKIDPSAKMPAFNYNEVTTYHSSLKALSAGKTRSPTDVHFTVTVSWRPWLEMGDIKGNLFGDGTGRHIENIKDFPPLYVELTRKHHPDAIADPEAILAQADKKPG